MKLKKEIEEILKKHKYNEDVHVSDCHTCNLRLCSLAKQHAHSLIPKEVPADKQNEYYQGYHACRQQMVERNK